MTDFDLVGRKLTAVRAKIREMADAGGYGHFITDATVEQWAAILVSTVDDVENPPKVVGEVAGVSVTGVDTTGG